jgi:hypothetical protein
VLLKELRGLGPQQSESLAACCLRLEQLFSKLESVACPQSTQSVIHDMLCGGIPQQFRGGGVGWVRHMQARG